MTNLDAWSAPLPLRARELQPPPWSLNPATLPLRIVCALGLIAAVSVAAQLLGPLVSEDNDMLAHLGVLVASALYLGRGPAGLACLVALLSLSFGHGHSGFAVTSNGMQFALSFAVFIFTVHQVSRLADKVRFEAWRSQQSAQLLGWFREFSQSLSQESTREGVRRISEEFFRQRVGAEQEPQLSPELVGFWKGVKAELESLSCLALSRIERTEMGEKAAVLEATQSLQSTLINSLSHDLQTPLSSVLGAFEMLKDPHLQLEPEARYQLADIGFSQTNRLLSLVRNMINLAKLEGGGIQLELSPVELYSVLEAARQRFAPRLAQRIELRAAEETSCLVWGDRTLLTQIFFNLLDNALKFSPSEAPVVVELSAKKGAWDLAIRDQGCGVEFGERELIFQRFYRGSTPSRIPGSGLGLHLCRGLVELQGGQISVESQIGEGATFILTLPRHFPQEHAA